VYEGLGAKWFDYLDARIHGAWWNKLVPDWSRRYIHFGLWKARGVLLGLFGKSQWPDEPSGFDVCHWVFLAPPGAKMKMGPSVIFTVFSTGIRKIATRNTIFQKAAANAVYFDILSEDLRLGLIEAVGDEAATRMITAPCSFIDYSNTRIGKKRKIVAFSGRFHRIKNPLLFVEMASLVLEQDPEVEFFMMGNGPLETEISKEVDARGISDRVTIGHQKNPGEILSSALVFVSIQNLNNYPSQALIEAMACGCATVASDEGETFKLVNDETGKRVPLVAEDIANAVIKFIKDPDLAMTCGEKAREKVISQHTVSKYAEHLRKLYELARNE